MTKGIPTLLLACTLSLFLYGGSAAPADSTKELMLTPLIKAGDLDKARAVSEDNMELSKIKTSKAVKSFSGYLTVDEASNSNLFFWFFPAQTNAEKAPVILWINAAPGLSCLASIFVETGPFSIGPNNELLERNTSWTNTNNMLYIDAPVGSGFSFTDKTEGFAQSSDDEASEVYEALSQFFMVFKEYQPNEFYMAGKAYAGTFIPHIANKIDTENGKGGLKINMKGFIMDSPWFDVLNQSEFADFFYSLGLVDEKQRDEVLALETKFKEASKKGDVVTALAVVNSVAISQDSLLSQFTGFTDLESALRTRSLPAYDNFAKFVETKEVHNYLHVGVHNFVGNNVQSFALFIKDFLTPHIDHVQELLEKDYKFLVIAPQFNLMNNPLGIEKVLSMLKWKGAGDFSKAARKIWRVMDDVAGYVKQSGSLTHVMLRNAGQVAFADQPEWTYDLINRFVQGKSFD